MIKISKKKKKAHNSEPTYPHFRKYLKSNHPALIIGDNKSEKGEEYRFKKVTHSEKDGRHLNEKIVPNPDPKDKRPMYIGKRVRHDLKTNFAKKALSWKFSKNKK